MLPTPESSVWSSSARLTPVRRVARASRNRSSSNAGSSGSRAMCATCWGTTGASSPYPPGAPSAVGRSGSIASDPKIRWSTNATATGPAEGLSRVSLARSSGSGAAASARRRSWPLIPRWASTASGRSPPARGSHRNLPRRTAARMVRPTRRRSKSSASPSWRRRERCSNTSTPVITAPRTTGSRPARTTSTSGSSGTGLQDAEGREGSGDLGLLLAGALARRGGEVADGDGRPEDPGVVGPARLHRVDGDAHRLAGGDLLQARLRVDGGAEPAGVVGERCDEAEHEGLGGLAAGGEERRADQRLHRVREDGGLLPAPGPLLAAAEPQVRAEADGPGDLRERHGRDERRAALRELPLVGVR